MKYRIIRIREEIVFEDEMSLEEVQNQMFLFVEKEPESKFFIKTIFPEVQ